METWKTSALNEVNWDCGMNAVRGIQMHNTVICERWSILPVSLTAINTGLVTGLAFQMRRRGDLELVYTAYCIGRLTDMRRIC